MIAPEAHAPPPVLELAPGRLLIPVPACPEVALVIVVGAFGVAAWWRVAGEFVFCPVEEA